MFRDFGVKRDSVPLVFNGNGKLIFVKPQNVVLLLKILVYVPYVHNHLNFSFINPFTQSPHDNIKHPHAHPSHECRILGRCWGGMRCCRISAMLPYLEITHTESYCHIGLCLNKPNTLWKLFGLDVPDLAYPTSCGCRWMGES